MWTKLDRNLKFNLCFFCFLVFYFFFVTIASQQIFPFHSFNHDEPVYLYQASHLLAGRLYDVKTPLSKFFLTWFELERNNRLTFKYTPAHALILSIGKVLFGSFSASLGLIAVAVAGSMYGFCRRLHQTRSVSLVATLLTLYSPIFFILSLTYLPYVAYFVVILNFFNLFYLGVQKIGRKNNLSLLLAGFILGFGFMDRPYDSILLAAPTLLIYFWSEKATSLNRKIRNCMVLFLGFLPLFIACLEFNHFITGRYTEFPFRLDKTDTFGFGWHRITPDQPYHVYDVKTAIQSFLGNLKSFHYYTFGGAIVCIAALYRVCRKLTWQMRTIAAILVSFPVGYFFFWGMMIESAFMNYLGPHYWLPCLIPIVFFASKTLLVKSRVWRQSIVVLALVLTMVGFTVFRLYSVLKKNVEYSSLEQMLYLPFQETTLSNAVVFVPPLAGGRHLLHPLAWLINAPNKDGEVVYALDLGRANFELLDAYPGRNFYRFSYTGKYSDELSEAFKTDLIKLDVKHCQECSVLVKFKNPEDRPLIDLHLDVNHKSYQFNLDKNSKMGSVYHFKVNFTSQTASVDLLPRKKRAKYPVYLDGPVSIRIEARNNKHDINFPVYAFDLELRSEKNSISDSRLDLIWPPEGGSSSSFSALSVTFLPKTAI